MAASSPSTPFHLPELELPDTEASGYAISMFVDQPPFDLICDLCLNVVKRPLQSPCCGKTRCALCVDQLILHYGEMGRPPCPYCRGQLLTFSDKRTELQVNTLHVYCRHKHVGCQWTGELCNLASHLKSGSGCQYVMVPCTNGCGEMCQRGKMADHLQLQCHLRRATCIYCHQDDFLEAIINSHYDKCPEYPLQCPHNCSNTTIVRKDLPYHLKEVCPLHVVECPFSNVGCNVLLRRKDMPSHVATSSIDHLNLASSSVQSLHQQVKGLQGRLQHRDGDIKYLLKRYTPKSWSEELWKKCRETTLPNPKPPFTFRLGNFTDLKLSQVSWTSPFINFGNKKLALVLGFQLDDTISFAICLMGSQMNPMDLQRVLYCIRVGNRVPTCQRVEKTDGEVAQFQVKIMNQRSNAMHYTSKASGGVPQRITREENNFSDCDDDEDSSESSGGMVGGVQVVYLSHISIAMVQKESGCAQYIHGDSIYLELSVL